MADKKKHKLEGSNGILSDESISKLQENFIAKERLHLSKVEGFEKDDIADIPLFDKFGNEYSARKNHTATAFGSIIYSMVISFPKDVTNLNNINLPKAKEIAHKTFLKIMESNKKYGFDSSYFNYDGAFHKKKDQNHIHMRIYQPKGTPKDKIMTRMKLSQWGFNEAKFDIANMLEGVREDKKVFDVKKELEEQFKFTNKNLLNSLSEKQVKSLAEKELSSEFDNLRKAQARVFKLFQTQPNKYSYYNKKTAQNVQKSGLALYYDNLSVPIYSQDDLKLVKNGEKQIEDCEKKIQEEQIIYKSNLDKYVANVMKFDETLNKDNKNFIEFCNIYKKDRLDKLAGNEKEADDNMEAVVDMKMNKRIYVDFAKNLGNEVIKCVSSANKANKGKAKASPTKTKLLRTACSGNVQKEIHDQYKQWSKVNFLEIGVLKTLSDKYLDEQLKKDRQNEKLKHIAEKQGISLDELKELIKEKTL
ncbi:MAG: hypothetical protein LBV53_00055 [Mycoplasmataceae bacterium]|nr:hypothetical protein [Mycoplasmataceae bacterium]